MKSYRSLLSTALRVTSAAVLLCLSGYQVSEAPAHAASVAPSDASSMTQPSPQPLSAQEVMAEAAKKANFKLNVNTPALKVGAQGNASVSIAVLNGYKWNKDYPSKLVFSAPPKNVTLGKTKYVKGDFKTSEKASSLAVQMQASAAGAETVTGTLKFSICNETACILEKTEVVLAVSVQP